MKKRTLVCFLIFTLCVFYSSIPNTVLGQEASLAQQVFDKHSETLQREDIQAVLPQVLEGLKAPKYSRPFEPSNHYTCCRKSGSLSTICSRYGSGVHNTSERRC